MSNKNILWITTDQQRFDTLGCYGNNWVDTEHIDDLANRGVLFEHTFSQSPVCTPSRASVLTGRYPRTTKCRQNGQNIPETETLITEHLTRAGYHCGLSGKFHLSACNPDGIDNSTFLEPRLEDEYHKFSWSHDTQYPAPANAYQQWLSERAKSYEFTPALDSEYVQEYAPTEDHQSTWCADRAIDFIRLQADDDQPWLFCLNIFDPHHPFDPPDEYLHAYLNRLEDIPLPNFEAGELNTKPVYQKQDHTGAYNNSSLYPFNKMETEDHRLIKAAYWAMIDLIDDQVGRVLEALEETGQRENTLVVFTSDHGEMLGDHGIYLKGPYFYEPAIRVPLILTGPEIAPSGSRIEDLVELQDLAPTLLEAAGIGVPNRMQARSFWELATSGSKESSQHRQSVYSEYYNAMPWHENDSPPMLTMLRTHRYKLIRSHNSDQGELYDLEKDPTETENKWANDEYKDIKIELLTQLSDRMARTVDPEPERVGPW